MSSSKVLESLVARGRRVRNFRETREITFGLADLSTQQDVHQRLVQKGGIETLVNILISAQDAEAQQFAALAIANTAATKSLCNEIIKLDGVVAGLVQYVANEQADSIGRQYSAMAIGNLLSDPATHETIVESGVIGAIITMLQNCCDARELESGKYAAFALANIASNRRYHTQIVDSGGIELLVALACCDDSDTQRQALAAIRGLCTTAENRQTVLRKGVLDPLILMSKSEDIDIVQEVAAALNCLSTEEDNKEEISFSAISTLISLMMMGDSTVERHSCCAIANLVEITDIHSRFLEERGIAPLIALCSSSDELCRVEAVRAVASLSSNPELIDLLIKEKALGPLVKSIEQDGNNCRYATLAIANICTHAPSLFKVVQAGAVPHLVALVGGSNNNLEGRRYAALALANMTACEAFHSTILSDEGPEALFALSNSYDDVESRRFVSCALANLSANTTNHDQIIAMGGLQPTIALVYDSDETIHKQAVAALRGFSATGNNTKIVHEGGLEPLSRLLLSKNDEVLIETTACFVNLSLADESKFEITTSGAVVPLISLIQNENSTIAHYACECLANLAEMKDNQDFIAREGAVIPCISAMRSRYIEVQRESGRLLANLGGSSNSFAADTIIEGDGHELLTSFLLSQDANCQRVGAFGIGNLCTHEHHRRTLMLAGVLEPLSSLARSGKVELEIRRFAMLAIANLASCFDNHDDFISQNTISMLVSFSNSADAEIRNYSAFAISEIAKSYEMMEVITNEGGLEAVLYLARSDDKKVQRQVLGALTTLSFLDCNKMTICSNGALPMIVDCISESNNSADESQLACCAIANLLEAASNMPLVVNHGCVPLLISALDSDSEAVQREAARACGNLAVNADLCDLVIQHGAAKRLVKCFQSRNCECQRMAALALSNLSSNLKSHSDLLELDILNLIKTECLASLDPKRFSDQETARFCILIISNLCGTKDNHDHLDTFFDILMDFTRHRDVKCRQHAVLAMGNLCTNPLHIERLLEVKCTDALVAFSFPPTTHDSVNAQFQAIAGLHGISKHADLRVPLLREGVLESLVLAAQGNNRFSCLEIQREAASTLSNLSLAEDRLLIAKSGALPVLINLLKNSDSLCQIHAATALANLAETTEISGEVQELMLTEQCLEPMCNLIQDRSTHVDVKRAVSRCISLFASNSQTHSHILQTSVIDPLKVLSSEGDDTETLRYCALTIANLALCKTNHRFLLENTVEAILLPLIHSNDVETLRSVSFGLHNLSIQEKNHSMLQNTNVVESLVTLVRCDDKDTALQACLAVKYLSVCDRNRNFFVESRGLEPLLALASTSEDLETKREVCATLRNLSLSDQNKEAIVNENGLVDILCNLARGEDNELAHQAIGVLATVAESQANQVVLVGIVHHLQFAMLSKSIPVLRESVRAFANLSVERDNTSNIVRSGALGHLITALESIDNSSREFGTIAMSNLASNDESKLRIVREQGVRQLMSIVRQSARNQTRTQQNAMSCLANIASCHEVHEELLDSGCAELSMQFIKSSNLDLRTSALLSIANFCSNSESHPRLGSLRVHEELIKNLDCTDRLVQFRAVTALRGLSTDSSFRDLIVSGGGVLKLLSFIHFDDADIKIEVLSTLCNLSLGGCLGDDANALLESVDMESLLSFLCNSNSTHRLFGAMAIGNIASHIDLQEPVLASGALQPLVGVSENETSDFESRRCIAYALCNLSADHPNRMSIILKGGLPSIMFLCHTGDTSDMLAALSTLKGLASSLAEARRPIVEEGVLHVLSLAMKSDCLECKRETAAILVLLSLNEENKFNLVRSDEMKELVTLTDMNDAQCVSQMCRSLATLSEVNDLHSDILDHLTVDRLVCLTSQSSDPMVKLEVSRLSANISSNFNTHTTLVNDPQLIENLGILCTDADADTRRFGNGSLANICLNEKTHSTLERKELVSILHTVINDELPTSNDETLHKLVESKCHACIAISALCQDSSLVSHIIEVGVVPALLRLLRVDGKGTDDLRLHVSFVFNKLTMLTSVHHELCQERVATSLISVGQDDETNEHSLNYSIASLRRVSDDTNNRVELIASNAIEFMDRFYDVDNIDRCREIASSVCHLALWDKARQPIIDSNSMFSNTLEMAKSSDDEVARFAIGALANIANDERFHDIVAKKEGLVSTILSLMQHNTLSIVRESSRALANVLSSLVAQTIVINGTSGIEAIVNVSKLEDYECQLNTAVAFRKLATNSTSHVVFLSQDDVFSAVVNLATHSHNSQLGTEKETLRNIKFQATAALRDIASNHEFKVRFAEMGGIETAIELASLSDTAIKTLAFEIIRHLSIVHQLKRSLVNTSGVVSIITDYIGNGCQDEGDQDLLIQIAESIANISEHAQNKVELVQMGILHCLVSLCKHDSNNVKRGTSRAFALLSNSPENVAGVFDEKVIPSILELLSFQEEEISRDAAAAISNVAVGDFVKVIGKLGGIPPLIHLLSSSFKSCQINSCKALCRLTATLEENKKTVFDEDGLSPIIQLCASTNQEVTLAAVLVLCNISTLECHQIKIVEENGLPTLKQLMSSDCSLTRKSVTMVLCNLTSDNDTQDHIARQIGVLPLFELINDVDCRVFATMAICNLAVKKSHAMAILEERGLVPLTAMVGTEGATNLQRAALLTLYNISTHENSHLPFVENNVVHEVVSTITNSEDVLCRGFSLLILANLACNDETRAHATKGGGLSGIVSSLKDEDLSCRRFACICLANMGNDTTIQSQIIVHGGLPSLLNLSLVEDEETQDAALLCLGNMAANEANHYSLLRQGTFSAFVKAASTQQGDGTIGTSSSAAIANMTSNGEILAQIGRGGGIKPLIALANDGDIFSQCLALSSLRRLAFVRENRDRMMSENILECLTSASRTSQVEIQREVAGCLCNLSLSSSNRLAIAQKNTSELVLLTQSEDVETVRLILCSLGNCAEDIDTHVFMKSASILDTIVGCLKKEELDIKRESARVVTGLLSSREIHPHIIQHGGLDSLILLSGSDSCEECRYLIALSFHKLTPSPTSHETLINNGLTNIMSLIKDVQRDTRKHAVSALRDLSSNGRDNVLFFQLGVPALMVELIKENDTDIKTIALSVLRHLSPNNMITDSFDTSGIVQSVIRCISRANKDMRCQIAGLFANLSEHRECHTSIASGGIGNAIKSLISIEQDEIWQDCSRTLANLSSNETKQASLHRQGCLEILSKLSKSKSAVSQRYVSIALRFMSVVEVQKSLSNGDDESSYFPYVEFSESNLVDFQRAAAAAFSSMSLNHTGKTLVLQKGGIKSILQLCNHSDLTISRDAVFSIANFVASPDLCQYVVKESGIETIKIVVSANTNVEVLRDASRALSSLSTDDATKEIMISQEIPKVLCKLAKRPDNSTQRFAALALCNLCSGTREQKELVVKQGVLRVLLFLLRFPDLEVERCASLAISGLTLGSDRNKAEVIDNGFVRPLIDTITYPDLRMRQCALLALNGISLGELPETKEVVFKENGLSPILDLVKSDDDESIHAGLYMLGTLAENVEIRDTLVAMDCLQLIVDKSSTGSIEIKRAAAYFLSLLSECPEYHDDLQRFGTLESVVALSSLVDDECQDYGAFTLAFLADNKSFQVPLVKMGGVRPLVSMMETSSQARHFAALALLKLADNFENHVAIAEEGGINALLRLGKNKTTSDTVNYQASLTVSQMAKHAVNSTKGSVS